MSSALSQVGGTLKRVKKSLGRIFKKSSKRSSKLKNHTFMLLDLRPGAGNMLGAYRCQYHIVFAPKYRRKEIYGQLKKDIGEILRTLCKQKNVEILEAEACVDHIHMLVSIPPYLSVAQFMGFLKGKSSLMIFDRHANLKYKYGSRNFWCRGYYVDTVGRNKKIIAEYIRNQLEEDYAADQISIKEYVDPFTGDKNKKA